MSDTDAPIGLSRHRVELVEYDLQWPILFNQEAVMLKTIFRDEAVSVDHFGSTAIPGIMAKPLLDIMVQTKSDILDDDIIGRLEDHSYSERIFNDGVARRMFAKGTGDVRTHHVHITQAGSQFATDMLEFRDILLANKPIAKEYQKLKYCLSQKFANNRDAYYAAKTQFFESVLGRKTFEPGKP